MRLYRLRNRRKSTREEAGPSEHRWLVSYADFITLLFAFFTMLYAISTVDALKLQKVVAALQSAFATRTVDGVARPGSLSGGRSVELPAAATIPASARVVPKGTPAAADGAPEAALDEVQHRLVERLAPAIKQGKVSIELERRGLVISIREAGSFPSGSADLPPETRAMLAEIAEPLREVGNFVRIEGHTDDTPIHTSRFSSNWELSTARATAVVALLIQELRLAPERLSAAGYSQYHPRAANDSAESRARNRRVDIVILNPMTTAAEEPAGASR
jgi:chemotaxis protein MotB